MARRLAELAQGNARKKRAELIEALRGRVTPHHRNLLKLHLGLFDNLKAALEEVDVAVGKTLEPIQARAQLLTTMPGVSDIAASVIVAEIGVDMSRFPSPGHLVSWAGLCPRNDESAGKRRSTRLRKGGTWLKTLLVTCAWTAVRTKNSYLRAQFMRIKSRRGAKKAIMAIAASMLTASYFMLRDEVPYKDLGAKHFDRHDTGKTIGRLVRRLQDQRRGGRPEHRSSGGRKRRRTRGPGHGLRWDPGRHPGRRRRHEDDRDADRPGDHAGRRHRRGQGQRLLDHRHRAAQATRLGRWGNHDDAPDEWRHAAARGRRGQPLLQPK